LQVIGSPLEKNYGEIISGALESSNTNITNEMVSMMKTQQAFNGNARIMQTSVDIARRLMDN
jgi:flagellar hook protein FlgE